MASKATIQERRSENYRTLCSTEGPALFAIDVFRAVEQQKLVQVGGARDADVGLENAENGGVGRQNWMNQAGNNRKPLAAAAMMGRGITVAEEVRQRARMLDTIMSLIGDVASQVHQR